jgi:diguanylate cyclase
MPLNMAEPLIELGLLNREQPSGLIDRLLALLSDAAVEGGTLKTREFRSRLQACRQRLAASDGRRDFARYSTECLQICEDFFARSRKYLLERESEFAEVINFLRESVSKLAGEANSFTTEMSQTSERMERLADIEDIRELKKRISNEVQQLKRNIEEKKQKDAASYTRLSKRVELLQHSLEESREEASLDGLTNIPNRRTFDRTLQRWIAERKGSGRPFVLAILDLDNFKAINDTRGHPVGDRVLICAARFLGKSIRQNDFLARFGGEEFVVLLDGLTAGQAHTKFTDILQRLAASTYDYEIAGGVASISFTASCGLAENGPEESPESLLRRADEALYEAKKTGKNRAVVAQAEKKSSKLWRSLQPLVSFRAEKPV